MKFAIKEAKGKKHDKEARQAPFVRRLLISAGSGFVLLAVLLCAAAAVCLRLDVAQGRMGLIAIPLAGFAAFAAGYFNVRPVRRQGLAFGMLAAVALYLLVLVAALVVSGGAPGLNAVLLLPVMLLCGAAGGIVAANRVSQRSTKTRKRK